MKIRQETRCRKCSPKNREGDYGHDEHLSYLDPSSPRRHTLGGNPIGSLMMKVVTPQLPIWLRPIAPDSKHNPIEKMHDKFDNYLTIRRLNARLRKKSGESLEKKESFEQVPKIADAPIEVVKPEPEGGLTNIWEGGSKFDCGEQQSRTFSPRRKTALSQRNLR